MRVLVAEDDKVSRFLLERLLGGAGYEFLSTVNGEDAIDLFRRMRHDCAILDWMMPKADGIEVARKIRELEVGAGKRCYIIMVTAKTQKKDMLHALSQGVDDFMVKPFDREALLARLAHAARALEFTAPDEFYAEHDPITALNEDHGIIRTMNKILDLIARELDEGVPDDILRWASSTTLLLTLELHHEKEGFLIEALIDRLMKEQDDWLGTIATSSFAKIDEEHQEIEQLVNDISGHLQVYLNDGSAKKELRRALKAYVRKMRSHAKLEEDAFFPFARRYLNDEDMKTLSQRFEEKHNEIGRERILKHLSEVTALAETLHLE